MEKGCDAVSAVHIFKKNVAFLCAIFVMFAWFWAFFAHLFCANVSGSKLSQIYFVCFFHLCLSGLLNSGHIHTVHRKCSVQITALFVKIWNLYSICYVTKSEEISLSIIHHYKIIWYLIHKVSHQDNCVMNKVHNLAFENISVTVHRMLGVLLLLLLLLLRQEFPPPFTTWISAKFSKWISPKFSKWISTKFSKWISSKFSKWISSKIPNEFL